MQNYKQRNSIRALTLALSLWNTVTDEPERERESERENFTLFTNKYPILPIGIVAKKIQNSSTAFGQKAANVFACMNFKFSHRIEWPREKIDNARELKRHKTHKH